MYNKTSFINETDYAEVSGFAQLCGRSPIMRKIMRAHNRIIQRSLVYMMFHLEGDTMDLTEVTVSFPGKMVHEHLLLVT